MIVITIPAEYASKVEKIKELLEHEISYNADFACAEYKIFADDRFEISGCDELAGAILLRQIIKEVDHG